MWRLKDSSTRLSEAAYVRIIEQFSRINPKGSVVLTGGEIFLKPQLMFAILSRCHDFGLETVVNTNGTLIPSERYESVIGAGPSKLVFSIDSHRPELHDHIRGIPGTYRKVVSCIEGLLRVRRERGTSRTCLYISAILHKGNISELGELVSLARGIGVDGITFQPLIPTFSCRTRTDPFFHKYFLEDSERTRIGLNELMTWSETDMFILLRPEEVRTIQNYVLKKGACEPVCEAWKRNLVIDHTGNLAFCHNMSMVAPEAVLPLTEKSDLESEINTYQAKKARSKMAKCTLPCGLLNCN
jgi:MoaA/NifB/PqqE/SkfB family radical SAM enzyme